MTPETSRKVADILIENLKEAFKAVDLSITLAFTCVVFLLMHGLQGDFAREISAEKARAEQSKAAVDSGVNDQKAAEEQKTAIPLLGLEANLTTASLVALTLYWIFCLRAAFRSTQAKVIAQQLANVHPEIIAAVLLFPSLATSGTRSKISLCVALGLITRCVSTSVSV